MGARVGSHLSLFAGEGELELLEVGGGAADLE